MSQAERAAAVGWALPNSDSLYGGEAAMAVCVHVCVHVCGHECAHVCARVSARAYVRACVRDVFAIYDKNYLTQADNDKHL